MVAVVATLWHVAAKVEFGWHRVSAGGWMSLHLVLNLGNLCSGLVLKRTTAFGCLVRWLSALAFGRNCNLGMVELLLDDDLRRPIQNELDWARMGVFSSAVVVAVLGGVISTLFF